MKTHVEGVDMMKRSFGIAAVCDILFFVCGILRGGDDNADLARSLCRRFDDGNYETRYQLNQSMYKSVLGNTYFRDTRWTDADGTKFYRHEIWKNGKLDCIKIRNAEGFFDVFPEIRTAIKRPAPLPEEDLSGVTSYEMRSCTHDGVDAWEIKKTIPITEETFQLVDKSRRNMPYYDAASMREAFFNQWAATSLYYVDKQNGLPLALKCFNRNGKQVSALVYRDSKPLREFPQSAFTIPETYIVERPATDDDFEYIMRRTWISIQRARRKAEKK